MAKRFALAFIFLGSVLLGVVTFPIIGSWISFQIKNMTALVDPSATTHLSNRRDPVFINVLGFATTDYSLPANWFPSAQYGEKTEDTQVKYFSLSVPDVNILDIAVEVNGSDLKKNAIHYPGTSLPGKYGNTVIFGHSALPQFYKKDDPLTIFNPLVKSKVGQKIVVNFDGASYTYVIKKIQEVTPDKVEVLGQAFDRHTITLITCTPLGTYWHRFVVTAELLDE